MGQFIGFVAFFDVILYNCWHRALKNIFTRFATIQTRWISSSKTGNIDNAKKEKRITGGIPEEESGDIQNKIEIEGRVGETESTPQEKVIREQRRVA